MSQFVGNFSTKQLGDLGSMRPFDTRSKLRVADDGLELPAQILVQAVYERRRGGGLRCGRCVHSYTSRDRTWKMHGVYRRSSHRHGPDRDIFPFTVRRISHSHGRSRSDTLGICGFVPWRSHRNGNTPCLLDRRMSSVDRRGCGSCFFSTHCDGPRDASDVFAGFDVKDWAFPLAGDPPSIVRLRRRDGRCRPKL